MNLTSEQNIAIQEIDHHLQIVACAGSGKTEVIARRIAYILQHDDECKPENIVAFTFTNKAADSLRFRINTVIGGFDPTVAEQMYVGTIHAFCYNLLCNESDTFNQRIIDSVKNHLFVARYSKECGMSDLKLDSYPRNNRLFLECIDKMVDDYENKDNWTQEQRDALEKYVECLSVHGYIDYSLLIFETLRQIEGNKGIRDFLSQVKYLVVDEYQDVDDLQEKLIHRIADFGANICVVGDDDQTIYQFRGSNAENMITFAERYPGVRQARLERNFRSASGIVDVAECVIRHNRRRIKKTMVSEKPGMESRIETMCFASKQAEFDGIAERIVELHNSGLAYGDIAILVRKGKTIAPISMSLERAAIPYETDSAEQFFTGNYYSRFASTMQFLADMDKAKLYECWQDIVDSTSFSAGFKYLRSASRGGKQVMSDIILGFCERVGFLNEHADDIETRKADLKGICRILDDYDEIYGDWQLTARINGALRFLSTQAAEEYRYININRKDSDEDAVQIMTVHKAKGLEFHTVFLPELMKREFPVSNMGGKKYWHVLGGTFEENKSRYQSDLEDERKLFYVAVTRARQNLFMTYELSAQSLSLFVKEAATSKYLAIDKGDLEYDPEERAYVSSEEYRSSVNCTSHKTKAEWDEECRRKREFWAAVKYARHQLYDYYGTATHYCPGAYGDLTRIKNMSPNEILDEASRYYLI